MASVGPEEPETAPAAGRRGIGSVLRGNLTPYHALVVLGALPLLVLAVFAYLISARAVETLVRSGNDGTATITAAMIEREFEYWTAAVTSQATLPSLAAAVAAGDTAAVRRRLEILVTTHPRLDRAFVTDTTGLLWADYPRAPESLGRRFDDRDWFRGVTAADGPYVSEVYRRNAEPRLLVVAVAMPVRDPATDETAGYVVAQVHLGGLSELLSTVEVGAGGMVMLLDHAGAVAAHPTLAVEYTAYRDYAGIVGQLETSGEGDVRRGRYADPYTDDTVLASAVNARVGNHAWTVISQQPVAEAFAAMRTLAAELTGAGVLLAALVGALVWGLGRANARRSRAEAALVAVNEDLERRVEERTAALRQTEEELLHAQKMEAVGRLAGGVAHDFNNLLTIILGSTEELLESLPEGAAERREVRDVHEAAHRAASLTRQLLAFSRKQVMQPRIIDLNEVLEEMRGILERVLGEHISIVWQLAPELKPVRFDPTQIEQVVMNLAVNASDAMPEGGRLVIQTSEAHLDASEVEEGADVRPGSHVVLSVSDSGYGMDIETRRRIFEPFFTTKQLGRGTGLGLSTVYGIVRQGGGDVWVDSAPGEGSTFKIYLPSANGEVAAPAGTGPAGLDAAAPGTGVVLVVEDETDVRALLVRVLEATGYTVLEAADAGRAQEVFAEHDGAVDLLLTDVILPDLSGPELVRHLEAERSGVRVLYMSGYTDDMIARHGVLGDSVAFLQKPLRPRELVQKVQAMLAADTS